MDQTEIASWFSEQGLSPGVSADEQLCFLWKALQSAQGNLSRLNKSLDSQQSQYAAEILEVRKSLEQIRVFTGHKDVLAQEIQDENDQLRDQLQRLVSLQDLQISEVAKMLYDQGLTELIHSSPSEQVAYLLVERASLMETLEAGVQPLPGGVTVGQNCTSSIGQTPHKRAPRHNQNPWKKLLGLHKNQKYLLIPAETKHLAEQTNNVQKECFRLERDLEEGSRRLAMAHNEIRRLTDELESTRKILRAYEPELKAAKHEVDQLRQVVQQLKKYEIVNLRKAKEQNNHLEREIQVLRSRQQAIEFEVGPRQQGALVCVQVQTDLTLKPEEVTILRTEVEKLLAALQEQQTGAEKARELNKTLEAEVIHNKEVCQDLQRQTDAQMKCLQEQELEIEALKLQLENCQRENKHLEQMQLDVSFANYQLFHSPENHQNFVQKDDCDSVSTKDVCKSLQTDIWETPKCFDQEQRKYLEMQERLKLKLRHVKLELKDEMEWRDEKIEELEREFSLCSHALTLEKKLSMNVMMENDKLLIEKRRLVQQLNEEVNNSQKNITTGLQSRIDFLEMENRDLQNRVVDLSAQISSMERSQNIQSLREAEELKNTCDLRKILTQLPAQTSSLLLAEVACHTSSSLEGAETWSQCSSLPRSGEMGYLNLNSYNHSPQHH